MKTSWSGVILGVVLGLVAAMISGTWIFWLGAGLALGMLIGAASTRRALLRSGANSKELRA